MLRSPLAPVLTRSPRQHNFSWVSDPFHLSYTPCAMQGGRVEVGAPTGRWQMVVVYRGKHDPLCITYLAALQVR